MLFYYTDGQVRKEERNQYTRNEFLKRRKSVNKNIIMINACPKTTIAAGVFDCLVSYHII